MQGSAEKNFSCRKAFTKMKPAVKAAFWAGRLCFIAAISSVLSVFSSTATTYSQTNTKDPRCCVLQVHLLEAFRRSNAQTQSQQEQRMPGSLSASRRSRQFLAAGWSGCTGDPSWRQPSPPSHHAGMHLTSSNIRMHLYLCSRWFITVQEW